MHDAEKIAFLSLAARGAAAVPKAAGKLYWKSAQNAPMPVFLGTVGTVATAPTLLSGEKDPAAQREKLIQKLRTRHLAASAGGVGMKTASVHFDEDEVRQAVAIRRQLEKTAAKRTLGNLLKSPSDLFTAGMLLGLGGGVSGAATAGAAYGAGKLSEMAHASGRDGRFQAMLKADPSLGRNPKARSYFNILDKASPYIAGEPHVAASTVRTMLESPEGYGAAPRMMKDILGVEKDRIATRFPALRAPTFKGELPDFD